MKTTLLFLIAMTFASFSFGQSPERMSYQSIIRNSSGDLLTNQAVAIRISILLNSASGAVQFSERHTATTNDNGLVSIVIGTGTALSGTIGAIDWSSGSYFIETETDPNGGTNYTISSTQQLLSVPYALHAKTAQTADALVGGTAWNESGAAIFNTNSGNVGIGTSSPADKLSIVDGNVSIRRSSGNNSVIGDLKFSNTGFPNSWGGIRAWQEGGSDQVSMAFHTSYGANPARMFIQAQGNIGIGSNGYNNTQLDITSTQAYGVYVGNPSAADYALYVNGTAAKPGGSSWTVASDSTLKTNIAPYSDGLSTLMGIKPVTFQYNASSGFNTENQYVGVLAQELQEVAPYMVGNFTPRGSDEEFLSVDDHSMTYMLINAVKEQQAQIEALNDKLSEMQEQLDAMEK